MMTLENPLARFAVMLATAAIVGALILTAPAIALPLLG